MPVVLYVPHRGIRRGQRRAHLVGGPPTASHVTHTIMDDRVIYDRAEQLKLPYERRMLGLIGGGDYGCCMGVW